MRVLDFFIESINSNCHFASYPCRSLADFKAGKCNTCGTGCANMGYDSNNGHPHHGTYYLSTNGNRPFCKP
ncbi:hypothetical protein DPMN_085736 [Dreissena polymorpha]|uniref:Lipase domain-containing protein n=1 Tax=Dreissena polymorpha TaxID=45954 RepID=A0A9D3YE99_DREPO|nr:hypothetical protein DPMN_085736 [Dreissena polymorpha]